MSQSSKEPWERCQDNEHQKTCDISSYEKAKAILTKIWNYSFNYI